MKAHAIFGYGSLVNRETHSYEDPRPATLRGWRRVWRMTPHRNAAYLTVRQHEGSVISGVCAEVPDTDWPALDVREAAYTRVQVTAELDPVPPLPTVLYRVPGTFGRRHHDQHHILLSYLDVVVRGYLQEFGEDGVRDFFGSTSGWDLPILDDRAAPKYERHQTLTQAERKIVDRHRSHLTPVVKQL